MIRVAVIGAGHWGPHLVRNFHNHQDSKVVAVADLDEIRLKEIAVRYPDIRTTENAEYAIGSDEVDAVVIASPTSTHYPLARLALESGKHVLVEKPLSTSSEHGRVLCDIAAAR